MDTANRQLAATVCLLLCTPMTWAQTAQSADTTTISAFYTNEGFGANRRGLEEFRTLVEDKLGDRLRIEIREISTDPASALELVTSGRAIAAPTFSSVSTRVAPSFNVFQLPYLFPDIQAVHGALDSEPGARLQAETLKKGFITLGFFDGGFGWVYSKDPLRSLADYKGRAFIVPRENQVSQEVVKMLGASPSIRSLPEIPSAISGRANEAALLTTPQAMSLGGVKDGALTVSNHAFTGYALLAGTALWSKLSDRDRQLLIRAGREASRIQREELHRQTADAIARITGNHAVYNPSASENAALRKASSQVKSSVGSKVGAEVVQVFENSIEKRPWGSALVPIWYGTNRNPVPSAATRVEYGNERTAELRFGKATVLVPVGHEFPQETLFEGLFRWVFRTKQSDGRLRVVEVEEKPGAQALDDLRVEMKRLPGRSKTVLIYIHGFKNSFQETLSRAAQITYDIKFPGATVAFSWPSKQDLINYPDDEATVEHAEELLLEFLSKLQQYADGAEFHILAHSMGNRALMRALSSQAFANSSLRRAKVGQIILAAPDVDLGKFENMARGLPNIGKRITLYVSARDKALATSKWLHGYPRAGYAPPISVFRGIDTIDASNINVDAIGHGYIGDTAALIYDLAVLVRYNESPEDRLRLRREVNEKRQTFWRIAN